MVVVTSFSVYGSCLPGIKCVGVRTCASTDVVDVSVHVVHVSRCMHNVIM